MKIESSNIQMYSQRTYQEERTEQKSISFGVLTENVQKEEKKEDKTFSDLLNMQDFSDTGTDLLNGKLGNSSIQASDRVSLVSDRNNYETVRRKCIIYLLELLFRGDKTKQSKFQKILDELKQDGETGSELFSSQQIQYGMKVSCQEMYYESENTNFQTKGMVRTSDGRELQFQIDVSMTREFASYVEENYEIPTLIDPLIIHLDGSIPSLSDQKFMFDLDSDGTMERISMLDTGSGFLALDRNQDGVINDGSELFGTASGDGFRDLAKFDVDGNGWIDEADPIFEKLMIWTKDENGNDELYGLKEAGVGAICLQKAETDFSLTSIKNNQLNGKVRSTGIFLYENGNVGTLQHLDVAT